MLKMNKIQYSHGNAQIILLSHRWGIPKNKVAKILADLKSIHSFWDWANADEFLSEFIFISNAIQNYFGEEKSFIFEGRIGNKITVKGTNFEAFGDLETGDVRFIEESC